MNTRSSLTCRPKTPRVYLRVMLATCAILLTAAIPAMANDDLDITILDLIATIQGLEDHQLRNPNRKIALVNKLEAVMATLNAGRCSEAMDKIDHDIGRKMDGCAESSAPDQNDWIVTCEAQAGAYAALMFARQLGASYCETGYVSLEQEPEWNRPDLVVSELTVAPEKVDPGDMVTFRAIVTNVRHSRAASATFAFLVDGAEVRRLELGPIAEEEQHEVLFDWTADSPGNHSIAAQLDPGDTVADHGHSNNRLADVVRVSGETAPAPELEFAEVDLGSVDLTSGQPAAIPVTVRNPGFVPVVNVPVYPIIDGVLQLPGDDVIDPEQFVNLQPDEEQYVVIPWSEVTPGQHTLGVSLGLPDEFPDFEEQSVKTWDIVVPTDLVGIDCTPGQIGRWSSMGPRQILNGKGGLPTGSVGRMDHIAPHPTMGNILYASSPTGGVWKSTTGGASWQAKWDGMSTLRVSSLAIDADQPDTLYAATPKGLYRSTDAANNWKLFASKADAGVPRELQVRHFGAGELVIYASGPDGVRRYLGSTASWTVIKTGIVVDLAAHPTDVSVLYVSVKGGTPGDGVYRTRVAATATGDGNWDPINTGLTPGKLPKLDVYRSFPTILYAAIVEPFGTAGGIEQLPWLGIFRSVNEGDSWNLLKTEGIGGSNGYNGFVHVNPTNLNIVYFGGVRLYKDGNVGSDTGNPRQITNVHDDVKSLVFDPLDPDVYYALNDGGIWRCTFVSGATDSCTSRNFDLRTTQFYDFHNSPNDKTLMIGGTQDNGTIMYDNSVDWKSIKAGDGNYSLIASSDNKVFYGQYQALHDNWGTRRCDKGRLCWWHDWVDRKQGLPLAGPWRCYMDGPNLAHITVHPASAETLLSQGPQVHATTDGGKKWNAKGPTGTIDGTPVRGIVRRVLYQPGTNYWVAGTSQGQLWYTKDNASNWHLLWEHPETKVRPPVVNMSFAPTDGNVLYVVWGIGGAKAYTGITRIHLNLDPGSPPVAAFMGAGFPLNKTPRLIAGDAHDGNIAYVGTGSAGVYRWDATKPYWTAWTSYNSCLPMAVDVRDMLVDPASKELRVATFGRGAWRVITGE